jgi:hypothetical protein
MIAMEKWNGPDRETSVPAYFWGEDGAMATGYSWVAVMSIYYW